MSTQNNNNNRLVKNSLFLYIISLLHDFLFFMGYFLYRRNFENLHGDFGFKRVALWVCSGLLLLFNNMNKIV